MDEGTTSLYISLLDPNLQTGSIAIPIEEHLDPLGGVSFTSSAPSTLDPGQKGGEFTVAVTGQGNGSSLSNTWYVNGEEVESETETESDEVPPPETLIFSFTDAGQYTITSSVTAEDGEGNLINWGGMAQLELTVELGGEVD